MSNLEWLLITVVATPVATLLTVWVCNLIRDFSVTTFTTEDIEALKTDWFPFDLDPVNEGEYEVMSTKWPWPHRAEWSKKLGWGNIQIDQWRGLRERMI